MSDASFNSLFRRGRYQTESSEDDDPEKKKRAQRRLELYTVAAVAFAMKHCKDFKRHFLWRICNVKVRRSENLKDYKVLLQPHDFDLVVLNRKKSEVIVVEFKIDARLERKQDFRLNGEFALRPDGYGCQIRDKYYATFKNKKYVVLLKTENPDELTIKSKPITIGKVKCYSRAWGELLYDSNETESLIAADLLNWLAVNIGEMKSRIYANMKNAKFTKEAAEMCGILRSVSEKILHIKKPEFESGNQDGGFWFGVNIQRDSKGFRGIKKYIGKKKTDDIGWFGYQQLPNECAQREIWIFTGSRGQKNAKAAERFIEKDLGKAVTIEVDKDDNVIIAAPESKLGDMEWFEEIIGKLKKIPKRQ